ncbi:MAG: hypothetical protein FJ290_33245 [Planctomycetes bacterium]|nr:hypothetical protein [Planctomycetota bacterium]
MAWRPKPEVALEMLRPFMDRDEFPDVPRDRSDSVVSLVSSVVGDCHMEMGSLEEAARWYRRASCFRKEGGYADFYAEAVIKGRLSDHYEHALECLRYNHAQWKNNPLRIRALGHILVWWRLINRPWKIGWYLSFRRRSKGFEAELEALVAATPGH